MLAAVALALFGLLSMHGWGSHASGHTVATPPATSAAAADSGHAAAHGQMAGTDGPASEADGGGSLGSASVGGQGKPGGDHGAGLLGLCLAVLSALLLGIALLLARPSVPIATWLLPTWPHPVFIGRYRDPPDLLRLCVIRC